MWCKIFAIFVDSSAFAKIKTAKIATSAISIAPHLPVYAGAVKITTTNISSAALRGDSAKFCTCENFPLYGNNVKNLSIRTPFRLLFECVANRLRLHNFSGNACLIIARAFAFSIYYMYCITLHCVIIIARWQKNSQFAMFRLSHLKSGLKYIGIIC